MQVDNFSNINNAKITTKHQKQAPKQGVAFRGSFGSAAADTITKTMHGIEKGGFFAEFLVVDALGMIFPRVFQALNRNKEELGHPNYAAATEEFLREAITGPSMLLIPLGILAGSGKMLGKSSKIARQTLGDFKNLTLKACEKFTKDGNKEGLNKLFYSELFDKAASNIKKAPQDALKEVKEHFVDNMLKLEEHSSANDGFVKGLKARYTSIAKKLTGQHVEQGKASTIKSQLTESLADLNKKYGEVGASTQISISNEAGKSKGIGDIIDDAINFSQDSLKTIKEKATSSNYEAVINSVHKLKDNARKVVNALTYGAVAGFLVYVPKIYMRNKEFPGLAGLKQEGNTLATPSQEAATPKKEIASARALDFLRKMNGAAR